MFSRRILDKRVGDSGQCPPPRLLRIAIKFLNGGECSGFVRRTDMILSAVESLRRCSSKGCQSHQLASRHRPESTVLGSALIKAARRVWNVYRTDQSVIPLLHFEHAHAAIFTVAVGDESHGRSSRRHHVTTDQVRDVVVNVDDPIDGHKPPKQTWKHPPEDFPGR